MTRKLKEKTDATKNLRGKEVATFHHDSVDFSEYDHIKTKSLNHCVALVVYAPSKNLGSICHYGIHNDLEPYIEWVKSNVPVEGTKMYLVGGMDGKPGGRDRPGPSSEGVAWAIERYLKDEGYGIIGKDILGRKTRNVTLFKDGRVKVDWNDGSMGKRWQSRIL